MTLRAKIVLILAVLAASATAAIGVVSYRSAMQKLRDTVDDSLEVAAANITRLPGMPGGRRNRPDDVFFEQVRWQVIDYQGEILVASSRDTLAVGEIDVAVAQSERGATLRTVRDGERVRVLTVPLLDGALMLSRSLRETDDVVAAILRRTLMAVLLVVATTLLAGWLLAGQVTRRLARLTEAADTVAGTGRLDVDVPADGHDEASRLGRALRGMLDALARSRRDQEQLVQDAGHELRTPLTSLRTNVSLLRRNFDSLSPEQREQVLADLDSETRELTDLVNELVVLAAGQHDEEPLQPVDMVVLAERVAARVRRRTGREIEMVRDSTDTTVTGRPAALQRAVQNLVDNACKFAPTGEIEVTVGAGSVTVRDHGPGIPEEDLAHVFDRFHRSVGVRSLPGSGLGLSIVQSVATAHGGTTHARNHPNGGAEVGFTVPVAPPPPG